MSQLSKIQWTDATWNPMRGCWPVSPGCANCYAARQALRHSGDGRPYEGLARSSKGGPRWTGEGRFLPRLLRWPLKWKGASEAIRDGRPSRIFVNSMSDLFFEKFTFEEIAAVFGVMAACPRHIFQILTKRPERALEFLRWAESLPVAGPTHRRGAPIAGYLGEFAMRFTKGACNIWRPRCDLPAWPLPNVWIGVSVEDQATADERIPLLLRLPAAIRFVSYEPALSYVDFHRWLDPTGQEECQECGDPERHYLTDEEYLTTPTSGPDGLCFECGSLRDFHGYDAGLDWMIVGGESGPRARPCDIRWILSAVAQWVHGGSAVFVKQLGSRPAEYDGSLEIVSRFDVPDFMVMNLRDPKGGDPEEWPEYLRVRQFPEVFP